MSDSATLWTAACEASLSISNSQSLLRLMSIKSVMSSHLILCRPFLLLPSIPPSIRVFSNELALRITWPKYWSFSLNISPSSEYSGLIFRIDWFDLLAGQGTLRILLQHQQQKQQFFGTQLPFFFFSASFIVQLSYPYTTTGKTIALTRGTFDYQVDTIITIPLKYLVQTNLVIFIFSNFLYWPRWLTRDFINKQNMKSYICVLIIMFLWQLS